MEVKMIRQCTLADRDVWCELNLKFMSYEFQDENVWEDPLSKGHPGDIFDKILSDSSSPNTLFLIEEHEKTIGFINTVYFESIWAHGKVLFIDDFFILEEYRGKCYGRKALRDLEWLMRENGYQRLQLFAEETNPKAIHFYDMQKYSKQKINFFYKYL